MEFVVTEQQLWIDLAFALLPIAAASGGYIGYRLSRYRTARELNLISSRYLQGLNYLLDKQEDEAIHLFHTLSDDQQASTTIKFALASLYVRRGEVGQAIALHEELLQDEQNSPATRQKAQFELANDYMKAGLFDRAERLYSELNYAPYRRSALQQLLRIYHQERDWLHAAEIGEQLSRLDSSYLVPLAHYYCQLAECEGCASEPNSAEIQRYIRLALDRDPNSVRASLLQGRVAESKEEYLLALAAYKRIEQQDSAFLCESIAPVTRCLIATHRSGELLEWLEALLTSYGHFSIAAAIERTSFPAEVQGEIPSLMRRFIRTNPSLWALKYLLAGENRPDELRGDLLPSLQTLINQLCQRETFYLCRQCGFRARQLHWNCPSCNSWGSIKPREEIR